WLDDAAELLSVLDVFVSASETESFGLAIAEAMACGVAVVATETDGAKELIQDQRTGLLAPVGNVERLAGSVASLLSDPQRRTAIGTHARESVHANFSLKRMVDE